MKSLGKSEKNNSNVNAEEYAGFISAHFSYIAKSVNDWAEKRNLHLSGELWFFLTLLSFLIINRYLPFLIGWSIFGLIILILLNFFYLNLPFIRRFFKTSDEEIYLALKKNDQDAIIAFRNYFQKKGKITSNELNTIFGGRLGDNYELYNCLFTNVKIAEDEIEWFIKKDFLNKPFVDDYLLKKLIKSCRKDISFNAYTELKEQLMNKKADSGVIKEFKYKFSNYSNLPTYLRMAKQFTDGFLRMVAGIFFIIFFGYLLLGIFILLFNLFVLGDKSFSLNQSLFSDNSVAVNIMSIAFIILIISPIIRFLLKKLTPSKLSRK